MNLRNVLALCGFFFLSVWQPANSTSPSIGLDDYEYYGYSEAEEDLCSSYCFMSVKAPLEYIMELKEQMKATAQANIDKDNRLLELTKRLLEMNEWKDQVKDNNKQIEYLTKTNDRLRASIEEQNQSARIEEFITKTINNQKEIEEEIKKNSVKLERIEKNLIEFKETINNQNKEIEDLKIKVANGKTTSLKLQQIEKNLNECNEKLARKSCKCLPSGIHDISISGLGPQRVLCNGIIDGGGWIVIHRRFDGSENFERNWTDFRNGFGSLDKEFFIGLESLHRITNSNTYELYIQIEYFNGTIQFASYDNFRIGDEHTKYELQSLGEFKGTAGDQMIYNLHGKFSTIDQDNDRLNDTDCAINGAWWHKFYRGASFNGKYYNRSIYAYDSINWLSYYSLKKTQMLIRSKAKV